MSRNHHVDEVEEWDGAVRCPNCEEDYLAATAGPVKGEILLTCPECDYAEVRP